MVGLRPRGRHKSPTNPGSSSSASSLGLSFDAIRTSLVDLRDSMDVLLPLHTVVDAALVVWDLADSLSTSNEHARELAWRTVCILDAIYNVVGDTGAPLSPAVLDAIESFEDLLRQISATMEMYLKTSRLHSLSLQGRESLLVQYVPQLDATLDLFKFGPAAAVEEQDTLATAQSSNFQTTHSQTVVRISNVFGGTGGRGGMSDTQGGVGGSGYGPRFKARTIVIQKCSAEHETLHQTISLVTEMRVLHTEVRTLRIVVLFGLYL